MLRTWQSPKNFDVPEVVLKSKGGKKQRKSKVKESLASAVTKPKPFNLTVDDMIYLKRNTHYDEHTIRYIELSFLCLLQ